MKIISPRYSRGQIVEVRSANEIGETLDANGKFDGVPFMPEMVKYCGLQARVFRRANKTCVEGHGTRSMKDTVFLEGLRCDGGLHDGCQRDCPFFWKEVWLKPIQSDKPSSQAGESTLNDIPGPLSWLPTRVDDRYYCQSTELYAATSHLSRWNIGQFVEEMRSGELSISDFLLIIYRTVLHRFLGFEEIGSLVGTQKKSIQSKLGLKQGEWVDVKNADEIRSTLDACRRNAGLEFVPSMSEYIGGRYQVDLLVHKIILEQTGKMIQLKNTVALKGVTCQGLCVKNCPRNSSLYWRETWLHRVEAPDNPTVSDSQVISGQ
jgi:hypothetical protein